MNSYIILHKPQFIDINLVGITHNKNTFINEVSYDFKNDYDNLSLTRPKCYL